MTFPATLLAIEEGERRIGAKLPDAHRQFLQRCNGGSVTILGLQWEVAPVADDSTPERKLATEIDIRATTADARQWPRFPRAGVAVAEDGCGNYLVYLPEASSGALAAPIYAWWHEGGELELVAGDLLSAISESVSD